MTTASPTPGGPADLAALAAVAEHQQRAGRLAEAAAAYRAILALRPDCAEVHNSLGDILRLERQLDAAAAHYEQALTLAPGMVQAYNSLAGILAEQGKLDEAAARLGQAIALKPDYFAAHNNLSNLLSMQDKLDLAAAQYAQALAIRPDSAEGHNDLGNVRLRQRKLDLAAACYQRALALKPDFFQAHKNLGDVFHQQGRLELAVASYWRAIDLRPNFVEAHNHLAAALGRLGDFDAATAHCEQALALWPDYAEAHATLGNLLRKQGRLDLATARFDRALALRPDLAEAHKSLGHVLRSQGQIERAEARYRQALALRPEDAEAHLGLATCYLLAGDYERGWTAYEWRLRMRPMAPPGNLARWNGQPLAGRSLLLVTEQGRGDTIQFVRYARVLKEQGARVALACQRALGPLLGAQTELDEVFFRGSDKEFPQCDFYLPLLSAPGALGTTATTIPAEIPYLRADPVLGEQWRRELAGIEGLKIGIAWQGARDYLLDRWRSIPLAQFAPLARMPGVRLISLQKGFGSEQIAAVDFPVVDFSDRLDEAAGPYMDTAALISGLDLVITSDTSIAHLAGALGVPVWVALPLAPDWRWGLTGDQTPWYPTMRLFRQTSIDAWPDVFERIASAVEARRSETA
ncbi:MAG TPA: tetratricopeptide repeat protein [Pirellulales bacterium]|jgi:tetratricopeptide (TPR) repeat protein|nr:tetratricopeptide repeat protein [Pirellulales bacterium]